MAPPHRLFSYGTLRQPAVQRALFGHEVASEPDALPGYRLDSLRITDPAVIATSGSDVHPILRHTGDPADRVEGAALLLDDAALLAADAYEVAAYARRTVTLASGRRAFAYLAADASDAAP